MSIFGAAILAAHIGPHGSLIQLLIVCSMGQYEPIANWPRRGLKQHFIQAAVGQLDPIGKRQFIKNIGHCEHFATAILAAHIGPCSSFMWQLIAGSMGQCEPIANWPMRGLT